MNSIPEEELRAEVGDLAVLCVVQRDGLDAAQDDVLGDLHAEAPEAGDEDVGLREYISYLILYYINIFNILYHLRHLLHGLVPQHVQLPRVERLVDVAARTVGRGPIGRRAVRGRSAAVGGVHGLHVAAVTLGRDSIDI